MTDLPLAERVYFIDSPAYVVDNTQSAVSVFLMYKEIQEKVMEVHSTKACWLRSKN
jgi:hypothetical protein